MTILLAALLAACAHAGERVVLDERAVLGTGGFLGDRTEAAWRSPKGAYRFAARLDAFRKPSAFPGTAAEYSVSARRELYHVSIGGRLGTRPPGAAGVSYHVAEGEALLTFYGLALGPEHPEYGPALWESTAPAPSPESLDRRWVTQTRALFTTTNLRVPSGRGTAALVQNVLRLELREAWRERAGAGAHLTLADYNREITGAIPPVHLDHLGFAGGAAALDVWPNNAAGLDAWADLPGSLRASAGFTRMQTLFQGFDLLAGAGLRWAPAPWLLELSLHRERRQARPWTDAASLSLRYAW